MIQIYPSVLETTPEALGATLRVMMPQFDLLQLDIADGNYVDNTTVPLEEAVRIFLDVQKELGLPVAPRVQFHLMVEAATTHIEMIESHMESIQVDSCLVHMAPFRKMASSGEVSQDRLSFPLGLSINLNEPVNEVFSNISVNDFSLIQFMGIVPGRQGQSFHPEVLTQIQKVRALGFEGEVLIDGGINEESCRLIKSAPLDSQPSTICPGSYAKVHQGDMTLLDNILNA